jgi:hypothetical protein
MTTQLLTPETDNRQVAITRLRDRGTLTIRDGIATALVAAIVVPYVGYLAWGEMPFIQDSFGMSGASLILGFAAFLAAGRISTATTLSKVELALAWSTLGIGVAAVALMKTGAAEVALGVLVTMIVTTWTVEMLHHAGMIQDSSAPAKQPPSRWS